MNTLVFKVGGFEIHPYTTIYRGGIEFCPSNGAYKGFKNPSLPIVHHKMELQT